MARLQFPLTKQMWKRPLDVLLMHFPPKKYVFEIPLYTTRIPTGVEWKVREENHVLMVYGEAKPKTEASKPKELK